MIEKEIDRIGRRDWNAALVEFFIGNHRLVILLVLGLLVGGAFSLFSLKREGFPQVPLKMLMVQTVYPGAGSEEVELQISKPIEDALKDADWVKEVRSTSLNSFSNVVVELDQKADIDRATQEIRNKVLTVEGDLPEDAEPPEVRKIATGGPAFIIGVSAPGNVDPLAGKLANELSMVEGIKSVKQPVERPTQVRVDVDPEKLAKAGLGIDQLIQILKGSNVNFPVARLDLNTRNQSLVVVGALRSASELKKVSVGFDPLNRRPLRLRDVAEVSVGPAEIEEIDRYGNRAGGRLGVRSGSLLLFELAKEADIVRVRRTLADRLAELKADGAVPRSARVEFIYDEALDTKRQVNELISGAIGNRSNLWLLGGMQLVVIAMLLMVNFRAAVIAALSIPFSLAFTFIFLMAAGLTFNTVVLFSLVLVLGLIVDPAIVIVESIQRFRDLGFGRRDAVGATARRYGAGVFMATLTNWIVFLPFGVVSGIFGEIVRYIPLTVIPALVASYFIPMAILPWLAERWLKPRPVEARAEEESLWAAARGMIKINRWFLARSWRQLAFLLITGILVWVSGSLVASGKVRIVQFSMPDDNSQLMATVTFDKGLTKRQRNAAAKKVERRLVGEKGINSFLYREQNRDQAVIHVILKEHRGQNDRSKKIVKRLNDALVGSGHFEFRAAEISYGPPESDYQVQVQLYGNNLSRLKKAGAEVGRFLKNTDGVTKVDDGVNSGSEPEMRVVLDREKTDAKGVSGFQVGQVLKTLLDQSKITKIDDQDNDRALDVMLRVDPGRKPSVTEDLEKLTITDRSGNRVPLAEIAKVEHRENLARIERFEGRRFITVKARVKDGKLFDVQRKLDEYLNPGKLKALGLSGTGNRGEFEDIAKSFTELFIALAIAIGLTYLVLVLQFRSFAQPMIMLFTIPPAMIGVFPALYLAGSQFGFLELLGFTILVGIVENVAIFLIDYANQRIRQDGMEPKEAIILASGVRFRPIILTKLVALGGLLPLAIASPFWRGLSITIITGIGLSGLFSLVIIPILFMLIVNFEKRLGFEL